MPSPVGLLSSDGLFLILAFPGLALLLLSIFLGFGTLFLRWRGTRKVDRWSRLREEWNSQILEVLAGSLEPDILVKSVQREEGLNFLDFLAEYVRRIRGEERVTLNAMARPFLPSLLEHLKDRLAERRAGAVQTLGLFGMPEYANVLRDALEDPSALVSMAAARSLLSPGQVDHLQDVMDHLHRFSQWHRAVLAQLLAKVGPDAAALLHQALMDSGHPLRIRAVVAHALRILRDVESADLATQVLESETDRELTVECLRLLAEVGESRHRGSVLPLLYHPDFPIRAQALRALRAVGSPEDLSLFSEGMKDESPWVAMEAARGMRFLGGMQELQAMAASPGSRSVLAQQVLAE